MRFALVSLLCSLVLTADTYPRQNGVDVLHYVFRLTLDDSSDEIAGEATVDVRFLRAAVSELIFDLASSTNGKGMTVIDVKAGEAPVEYKHQADRLRIALAPPPAAGERRRFTIRYRGMPAKALRIGPNRYQERTFFSENWPDGARQWLPCIDHPYDKATSEFLITAPSHYQVIANGVLVEETDLGDGKRLTHWRQNAPIATWLNAIGAARFSVRYFDAYKGIPLETWVYPQDREAGIKTFETPTRNAIEFFATHIAPYPYEKLANVQAMGIQGGTEHASAIFYGERSVTMKPATGLVTHEIAHQWFGNAVTEKDWDDVWLSEGFATYLTLLFFEHHEGRDSFVAGLKRSRDTVFKLEQKLPGTAVIHNNLSDMRRVLNQLVYQKGGWTLHMLRKQIGTEMFWAAIREYYRRYKDANASTGDFRRVVEETARCDLRWFFDQWLRRAESPKIDGSWQYDAARKRLVIDLEQKQPDDAYRLPLNIGLPNNRLENIEMVEKRQRFEIPCESAPDTVTLDPNTWVLMQAVFARR